MPFAKAEATKTIEVTGVAPPAAPPIPWWLIGLGAVAIVIIIAAARKT
jgi:hypothetical protein